jgi:hypothetical protein
LNRSEKLEIEDKIALLLEIAVKLELNVRAESLGGHGGGICKLKGQSILFIDLDASPVVRYERLLTDLSALPALEDMYLLPEIRDDLEAI